MLWRSPNISVKEEIKITLTDVPTQAHLGFSLTQRSSSSSSSPSRFLWQSKDLLCAGVLQTSLVIFPNHSLGLSWVGTIFHREGECWRGQVRGSRKGVLATAPALTLRGGVPSRKTAESSEVVSAMEPKGLKWSPGL